MSVSAPTPEQAQDHGFIHEQAIVWLKRAFNSFQRRLREERPEEARRLALAVRNNEASIVAHVDLESRVIDFHLHTLDGDTGVLCSSVPTPTAPPPVNEAA